MKSLKTLFEKNRAWAKRTNDEYPQFFEKLAALQTPKYLWIGCADSRVPANQVTGLMPGEVFVHRNVANLVIHTDLNCLSVMQHGVEVLGVEHVIVCGHFGCGGVEAAVAGGAPGLLDNWLRHIQDVHIRYEKNGLQNLSNKALTNKLCQLNVIEQAYNASRTTIVRDAWKRGQNLNVHAWIYSLKDGLLQDLGYTVSRPEDVQKAYDAAVAACLNAPPDET